ncbi:MAG: hypothetical protein R3B13_39705 [Polyangiaceae bacterium]
MTRPLLFASVLVALAAFGCEKKEEPTPAAAPAPAASIAAPSDTAGAEPTAAADEGDIPTEEDFEDEAEQQITASNLESELDKLEKEIGE